MNLIKDIFKTQLQDDIRDSAIVLKNKVSLQKQLNKILGQPTNEYKIKRSIVGSCWEIPFKEKSKISQLILKANIYEL